MKMSVLIITVMATFSLASCANHNKTEKSSNSNMTSINNKHKLAVEKMNEKNKPELIKSMKKLQDSMDGNFYKFNISNKNITVLIKNAYVVPPVTTDGDSAYLQNTFQQIHKLQIKHKTNYPILFKDSDETIGYSSSKGHGWYKDLTDNEGTRNHMNFNNGNEE
ncbi:hypothetical protein FXE12_11680 [Lactobacillus sp. SL9-6]|nr:hypothetical protein FXE12_11680 [Lactobacillus sp. SL9-6]